MTPATIALAVGGGLLSALGQGANNRAANKQARLDMFAAAQAGAAGRRGSPRPQRSPERVSGPPARLRGREPSTLAAAISSRSATRTPNWRRPPARGRSPSTRRSTQPRRPSFPLRGSASRPSLGSSRPGSATSCSRPATARRAARRPTPTATCRTAWAAPRTTSPARSTPEQFRPRQHRASRPRSGSARLPGASSDLPTAGQPEPRRDADGPRRVARGDGRPRRAGGIAQSIQSFPSHADAAGRAGPHGLRVAFAEGLSHGEHHRPLRARHHDQGGRVRRRARRRAGRARQDALASATRYAAASTRATDRAAEPPTT